MSLRKTVALDKNRGYIRNAREIVHRLPILSQALSPERNPGMKPLIEKREKTETAVPIGRVIDKILHSHVPRTAAEIGRIGLLWDKIVGAIIAENTRPAALKEKTLLVHVNSSPWLHHLHFLKEEIILKVNDALGENVITDIIFKIGPVP